MPGSRNGSRNHDPTENKYLPPIRRDAPHKNQILAKQSRAFLHAHWQCAVSDPYPPHRVTARTA